MAVDRDSANEKRASGEGGPRPMPYAPREPKSSRRWLMALGVVAGLGVVTVARNWPTRVATPPLTVTPAQEPTAEAPPVEPPIDLAALRTEGWGAVQPRLDEADAAIESNVDPCLDFIRDFFERRKRGSRAFAASVLSLGGKWALVKSKMPFGDDSGHMRFLGRSFDQHVFTNEEVRRTIERAVRDYVDGIESVENRLLVDIRADLADFEPAAFPALGRPTLFQTRFRESVESIASEIATDLGVDAARLAGSFVVGEIAAHVAVRALQAAATRLGVSAGVLSTGAAASWATFGVSIVAAIAVDIAAEHLLRAVYDPETRIAERMNETLDEVCRTLLGDADAVRAYCQLRALVDSHETDDGRAAAQRAADNLERAGVLGLRCELVKLAEHRSTLRREALKRLILDGAE